MSRPLCLANDTTALLSVLGLALAPLCCLQLNGVVVGWALGNMYSVRSLAHASTFVMDFGVDHLPRQDFEESLGRDAEAVTPRRLVHKPGVRVHHQHDAQIDARRPLLGAEAGINTAHVAHTVVLVNLVSGRLICMRAALYSLFLSLCSSSL